MHDPNEFVYSKWLEFLFQNYGLASVMDEDYTMYLKADLHTHQEIHVWLDKQWAMTPSFKRLKFKALNFDKARHVKPCNVCS